MPDHQPLTITDLHLRALLDASPVSMLVFNDREELILANPPAERLIGFCTQAPSTVRCGDVIRCANRLTAEKGCGHADACPSCPLFRGLRATIAGKATPADQEGEASLEREPGYAPLWIRYKIRPLVIDGKRGALLTVDDITALRQTEQRYTTLFREMLNAFALHEILCDEQSRPIDYRFLAVNPAFERITGLSADLLIGRTVLDIFPGIDATLIETYGRVALSGASEHFEFFSPEIGKYFAISAFCPTPGQFACLFEDISERKRTSKKLEQSEANYRSAYSLLRSMCDNVPDMIWAKDLDQRYLFTNAALCRGLLNAVDTEEPLDKSDLFFAERERAGHPEAPQWHTFGELCRDSDTATMDAGKPMQFDEFGNVRGQFLFLDVHKAPFLDEHGTMIGTVGSARDVTALKAMEQELREREQRLDFAIHGADLGTWDWHIPSGSIVINQRWAEMLGYSVEEMGPHLSSWMALGHPDDRARVNDALARHLRGETDHYETEHRLRHRSGDWIWVLDKGRVVERDGQGQPLRACGTHLDITRQKLLIEQSRDGIVLLDSLGRVREANRRFADMLGYTQEEVQHLHVWDWDTQWTREQLLEAIVHIDATGDFFETCHRRKDGTVFPVEISSNGSMWSGEKQVFCICRDISERKKSENALREQELFLRSITSSTRDGIVVMDNNGHISFWNPAAELIFGYTAEEALGAHLHRLLAPQRYHQAFEQAFSAYEQTGEGNAIGRALELDARHKSGRDFPIELSLSAFHTDKGWHTVGVVRDITERKQTEQQLRQSRDFLQTLLNAIPVRVFWKDLDLRYLGCNVAFAQDAGYNTPEELIGKDDFALTWRDQAPWYQSVDQEVITHGTTKMLFEEPQTTSSGEQLHLLTSKLPLKNGAGATIGVLGVYSDITERKKAEEIIHRNERMLRRLVDILQHPTGQVQEVFDHALENAIELTGSTIGFLLQYHKERQECTLCSWSREVMNSCAMTNPQSIFHLEQAGLWAEAIRQRRPVTINDFLADHPFKQGTPEGHLELRRFMAVPIVKDDRVVGVVGLANKSAAYDDNDILQVTLLMDSVCNIAERKQMEEERSRLQAQLVQAQKMEAIGTLAGGIAHDFNNILGAVIGFAEMAKEDSPRGSMVVRHLDKVLEASDRARKLVRQILAFSRQENIEPVLLDPEIIVREAAALLRPSLPATIAINVEVLSGLPAVMADPTQLHQIVINLATNAFHAMEATGGTLAVSLAVVNWHDEIPPAFPESKPGRFVCLAVEDTGPGIPTVVQERIFEPFFTTKEVGRGTGMGLATVHGIVQKYGGFITCDSAPGHGATFRVFLPAITGGSASQPQQEGTEATDRAGKGHILFVDDDHILVEMGQTMLERLGYEVTTRTSSLEALATFESNPHRFDAVITDQTMSSMTGLALARRLLQIRPELPIILCTGYSKLVDEAQAKACGIKGFVMKPLTKKEIAALLREVLTAAARTTPGKEDGSC